MSMKHYQFQVLTKRCLKAYELLFGKYYVNFLPKKVSVMKSLLLQLIQPEIKSIALHEFAVGTGFDDPAPVQYDNPVRFPGG